MSKESKTAKASAVKAVKEVKVIPDDELIRQLRIDRQARLYPTVQGTDALLREFDAAIQKLTDLVLENLGNKDALKDKQKTVAHQAQVTTDLLKRAEDAEQRIAELGVVLAQAQLSIQSQAVQLVKYKEHLSPSYCEVSTEDHATEEANGN